MAVLLDTAFWLLVGLLAAGFIKTYIPETAMRRWVGGKGFSAISRAALFGAPLPLCSCGVLPAAIGLHRAGASKEATVSFLISTPETSIDSVAVTYALMGPIMAIYRPIAALMSAMVTGMMTSFIADEKTTDKKSEPKELSVQAVAEKSSIDPAFNANATHVDAKLSTGFNANATIEDKGTAGKFNANETNVDAKSCCSKFNANGTMADKGTAATFNANETSVDARPAVGFNANDTMADKGTSNTFNANATNLDAKPDSKFNANETAIDATDVKICCSSKKKEEVVTSVVNAEESSCCSSKSSKGTDQKPRWLMSLQYAGAELLDDISQWLAIGIVLAGIMLTFIPTDWLAQWGDGLSAMLIMLVVGVPLYICAVASTPVAAGLLLAGVSPGAVLVFLLVGPATNITSFALIKRELGMKVTIVYLLGISVVSLSMGLLLELILEVQQWEIEVHLGDSHAMLPMWLSWSSAILLLFLAIKPLRKAVLPKLG